MQYLSLCTCHCIDCQKTFVFNRMTANQPLQPECTPVSNMSLRLFFTNSLHCDNTQHVPPQICNETKCLVALITFVSNMSLRLFFTNSLHCDNAQHVPPQICNATNCVIALITFIYCCRRTVNQPSPLTCTFKHEFQIILDKQQQKMAIQMKNYIGKCQ